MKMFKALNLLAASAVVLAACTVPTPSAPAQPQPPAQPEQPAQPAKKIKVGLVTDVGSLDDRSFNASAWEGVQRAVRDFGVEAKAIESKQPTDYIKNIQAFVNEGYDLIITVGFLMGDDTRKAAEMYPDQ
ncbi:MAG: BMP family ABC transporter substrate-binding protein, partial [Thermoflexales bacterium]|nr:BMP family ABC transporter substrate-binding protein [Thermoflexales bacterium]